MKPVDAIKDLFDPGNENLIPNWRQIIHLRYKSIYESNINSSLRRLIAKGMEAGYGKKFEPESFQNIHHGMEELFDQKMAYVGAIFESYAYKILVCNRLEILIKRNSTKEEERKKLKRGIIWKAKKNFDLIKRSFLVKGKLERLDKL